MKIDNPSKAIIPGIYSNKLSFLTERTTTTQIMVGLM